VNRALALVGVAEQDDKATAATNPDYWHGVLPGSRMVSEELTNQPDDVTTGLAGITHYYREGLAPVVGFNTRAFKQAIGIYLKGIFGNVSTTGAEAPYTHVFTAGDSIPWLTFFSKLDTHLVNATGCKLDTLEIKWDGSKPIEIIVASAGIGSGRPASITVPTADESRGDYYLPVGGTYKVDVDGATPVAAEVLGGSIKLSRSLVVDYASASVMPTHVGEGGLTVDIGISVRVDDMTDYDAIIDGADGKETSVTGSFEITFVAGTESLKFESSRVPFTASPPTADSKGGSVSLDLSGWALIAAGETTPITATLINSVATY
jgi:hypothetical protein